MNTHQLLLPYSNQVLHSFVLLDLLKDYKRPYDKIVELVKQGELIQLKRGLYTVSPQISGSTTEPMLIANHLYGPSYVSIDYALSYWGLIPERVFEISSVSQKHFPRTTINGIHYSYEKVPKIYFALGVKWELLSKNLGVLIASPEKALLDKIITTSNINLRSYKQVELYLFEDLRMDSESLSKLNLNDMKMWLEVCPKRKSIEWLIKTLEKL